MLDSVMDDLEDMTQSLVMVTITPGLSTCRSNLRGI